MKIGIVTCHDQRSLPPGDDLVYSRLVKKGYHVEVPVWDNPGIKWDSFDLLVIRSVWDYVSKIDSLHHWLDRLENLNIKVFNPPGFIKWNVNKQYLDDLSRRGWPVVPYQLVWSESEVLQAVEKCGEGDLILKPVISAGAYLTSRIHASRREEIIQKSRKVLEHSPLIIQPFKQEIIDEGEYSYVFFNNRFSHAALKKPKRGDFRVQTEHGGVFSKISANNEWVQKFEKWLNQLSTELLFARVDFINVNGAPQLVELEIFEPNLITYLDEKDAHAFAYAIEEKIN